jgi:hypothetical protein
MPSFISKLFETILRPAVLCHQTEMDDFVEEDSRTVLHRAARRT